MIHVKKEIMIEKNIDYKQNFLTCTKEKSIIIRLFKSRKKKNLQMKYINT